MRILVRAPIGTTGGYARDGVGLIHALLKANHEVDIYPTTVAPPLPRDIAELLTYPISGMYDLEIHHVPPTDALVGEFNKQRARKVVLWSMWEWDTFPESVPGFDKAMENIHNYDLVVGYTEQTLDAFRDAGFLGERQATEVVQGGFEADPWEPYFGTDDEKAITAAKYPNAPFRFGVVGHLTLRKNPYTVLTAFNQLKEEHGDDFNAELIFKTGYPLLPPNYAAPGVKLIQEVGWSDDEMKKFYWYLDCLINVAWGESEVLALCLLRMSSARIEHAPTGELSPWGVDYETPLPAPQ